MKYSAQAMAPEFFKPAIEEATKTIKKPEKGDENLLQEFSTSDAWRYLKGIMEGIQKSILEGSNISAGKAKTWEEVAKIYYGRDISIDTMQSIIDLIELHKSARNAEKSAGKEE